MSAYRYIFENITLISKNMQRFYGLLFLIFCAANNIQSQVTSTSPLLKVSGEVTMPLQLTATDLSKMKRATAMLKDRDGSNRPYSGVAVLDILNLAGVTTGKQLRGENLAKYMIVKCADGYEVLFSLAELDTGFSDKIVILADSMEGKPLQAGKGPLRLIMPGEKVPARSCFQVTEFVIRFGKE
jgi:DMSO/TMAO reductase YedYZ molybdopterin-dependent catalytic subunit